MLKRLLSVGTAGVMAAGGLAVVVFPVQQASAASLAVPGHYRSISAAVAAAHSGDTVLVSPGTYRESIVVDGKYVTIKATSSNPASTIIAAPAGHTAVMFQHVPAVARSGLIGFRVVSGNGPSGQGGGVTIANAASPLIQRDIIEGNHAPDGGGILVYNQSNPDIYSNTIRNNTASLFGAGIFAVQQSSPRIWGNTISGNRAAGGSIPGGGPAGGGIYLENTANPAQHSAPQVLHNSISGNTASFAGGGIMLRRGVSAMIQTNHIYNNKASYGGGIHVETNGATSYLYTDTIEHNQTVTNYAGSGSGGGVSVFGGSHVRIAQSTIQYNSAATGGGGLVLAENSTSTLYRNKIIGNVVRASSASNTGGGVYVANSNATLSDNLIRSNNAMTGGGVTTLGTGAFVLVNNTVVSNSARLKSYAAGGGIYIGGRTSGKASIVNNIFSSNNDYQVFEHGRFATYSTNLITTSGRGMFFSFTANAINTIARFNGNHNIRTATGNVSGSTGFVNQAKGDYRLLKTSLAVNRARQLGAPAADIRGVKRPFGWRDDIGAWEYNGH